MMATHVEMEMKIKKLVYDFRKQVIRGLLISIYCQIHCKHIIRRETQKKITTKAWTYVQTGSNLPT